MNLKRHLSPASAEKLATLTHCITQLLQRYPWAMPVLGFVSGAASFFLVEREKDKFAQSVAILMLASWVWLALEKLLRRGVQRWFGAPLPSPVIAFFTQMVHQESLFFVIPFFAITTAWNTGQMVFTSLLALFALVSILDPIYYHWLAARRWLYIVFHGMTSFAVLLTALPIIFHLPTPQAYLLSLGAAIVLSLPAVVRALPLRWWGRGLAALALVLLTTGIGIYTRPWIPPATLRLTKVAVTDKIDDRNRAPERELKIVTEEQLRSGLYAYTAIRAPRGLRERIYHEWRRNGRTVDRIALDINGGREAGYRAWTHKLNFPPYPTGRWEIHVLTEANQVIGILRFQVVKAERPAAGTAPVTDPAEPAPPAGAQESPETEETSATQPSPAAEEAPATAPSEEASPAPEESPGTEAPVAPEAMPATEDEPAPQEPPTPTEEQPPAREEAAPEAANPAAEPAPAGA